MYNRKSGLALKRLVRLLIYCEILSLRAKQRNNIVLHAHFEEKCLRIRDVMGKVIR